MRYSISLAVLVVCGANIPLFAQPAAPPTSAEEPEPAASSDEDSIRKVVVSYADAFNAGDAKKLASHWTEEGELATPNGAVIKGREALVETFTKYFEENKGAKLELQGVTIDVISPHVAIENGTALVFKADEEPSRTTYEAVHVKSAAGWKMDSVSEAEVADPPPSHYEQLASLEWMVGTWGNDTDGSQFESSCRWTTNRNFLVRTFRVVNGDQVDFEGTQIIGWDPHVQTIRSWVFDSDGGFGVGRWKQSGNRWTVQTIHHLPDGRRGTATNIYQLVDENTVQFASTARVVDGELMPSIKPVEISRQ